MNLAMWKDGTLLLLRLAKESFTARETRVGLALLVAAIAAAGELRRLRA